MKTHEHYENQLVAYLHGELNASAAAEVRTHLETCAACRAELETHRATFAMLGDALVTAPTPRELAPWDLVPKPKTGVAKIWYHPSFRAALASGAVFGVLFFISMNLVVVNTLKKEPKRAREGVFFEAPEYTETERPKLRLKKPRPLITKSATPKSTSRIVTKVAKASMPDIQLPEVSGVGYGGFNTEQYDLIVENTFLAAVTDPLSTFSIEVDTASYANTRRFLNDNQLPPPAAVRVEELVNYFNYDYPRPRGDDPFVVSMEVAACPWNRAHRLALVGLQGVEVGDGKGGTLVTIAKDVKIQIEFNPRHVKGYRLIGYENRVMAAEAFDDDQQDAGELGAGHTVTALYELILADSNEEVPTATALKYQKTRFTDSDELMTVKLRYKQPNDDVSKLIIESIKAAETNALRPNSNIGFASAVAEFGMLLRDSDYKGEASYDDVIQRAKAFRGEDMEGYRAEFIKMVEKAQILDRSE